MMKLAVVVGAGIGGLCTAIGLRDAGWRMTVLERWPSVVGLGTGIALWPDAEAALRRLGLGAVVAERAVALGRMSLFRSDGVRLGQFFNERLHIVHRRDLMDGLLAAAAGIDIQAGVDVRTHPDALDGADLVVGAEESTARSAPRSSPMRRRYRPIWDSWPGAGPWPTNLTRTITARRSANGCIAG